MSLLVNELIDQHQVLHNETEASFSIPVFSTYCWFGSCSLFSEVTCQPMTVGSSVMAFFLYLQIAPFCLSSHHGYHCWLRFAFSFTKIAILMMHCSVIEKEKGKQKDRVKNDNSTMKKLKKKKKHTIYKSSINAEENTRWKTARISVSATLSLSHICLCSSQKWHEFHISLIYCTPQLYFLWAPCLIL